jgi:hypothetical protein
MVSLPLTTKALTLVRQVACTAKVLTLHLFAGGCGD